MRRFGQMTRRALMDHRIDLCAMTVIGVVATIVMAFLWVHDSWFQNEDRMIQYIPWYSYLGDRLRDLDIPAWNPYEASGEPFIGNPTSAWLNLPVMVLFALFDAVVAYKAYVYVQMLVIGLTMYLFCRSSFGMVPAAASVGAFSMMLGPMLFQTLFWGAGSTIALMAMPTALLAVDFGFRSERLAARLGWSALLGFCFVQFIVGSVPRVIYAAAIVLCWMAYRTFVDPVITAHLRSRIRRGVEIGVTSTVLGLGFALSTILPQIDFIRQSVLEGGEYGDVLGADYADVTWSWDRTLYFLLSSGDGRYRDTFIAPVVAMLALLAICTCFRHYAVWLFLFISFVGADLSSSHSYLRDILWLIPGVEANTSHRPTAAIIMLGFSVPVLAAAGAQWLVHDVQKVQDRRIAAMQSTIPLGLIGLAGAYISRGATTIESWQWLVYIAFTVIAIISALALGWERTNPSWPSRHALAAVVLSLLIIFPMGTDMLRGLTQGYEDPDTYPRLVENSEQHAKYLTIASPTDPGTTAEFLQQQQAQTQPFRFTPFFGGDYAHYAFVYVLHPDVIAVLANGRPIILGLQHPSSYSPIHLKYYTEYINAINGQPQDYHFLALFQPALDGSQLFDMLNIRYITVRRYSPPPIGILDQLTEVYVDHRSRVYENPNAFPRAWIVHDIRQDSDGLSLAQFNSGAVDGRVTAFVSGEVPTLVTPPDPGATDSAVVTSYAPEEMRLRATANGDGLLVLSEVYAEGWNAYVDGEQVEILRTNHALRGVPLTDGSHEVVLKYEPRTLQIGLIGTTVSATAMIGIWVWAAVDRRRFAGFRDRTQQRHEV